MPKTKSPAPQAPTKPIVPHNHFEVCRGGSGPGWEPPPWDKRWIEEGEMLLICSFFFVADTRLSSGHPAYGVRGYSSPKIVYGITWETYSFMRMRHVPVLGTLWGGGNS